LPDTWTGLPPGLPREVIEDLARRAREAEKKVRQQRSLAKQTNAISLGVAGETRQGALYRSLRADELGAPLAVTNIGEGNVQAVVSVSGAPLSPEVWKSFEKTFHAKLVEGYGLTETSPVVAVNPPFGLHKHGSVGLPIPGVEVRLVDADGSDVRAGEVGELVVRGGNVMKGYLHRPQDTREVLRDGWLYTGDLARLDEDGYLYIAGRKKELIIVGGLNVYPGEVERVLVEDPAVLEAAAFGVDDPARGEAVWAAVVLRPDHSTSERDLRAFCREKLASFKVPRGIEICSELPKNALGKVMRHVLREEIISREEVSSKPGVEVTGPVSGA
jgi:long-chain acyl-CoA synthetase